MISEGLAAKFLATVMHAGQTDKAGRPYIEHVARVAYVVPEGEDVAVAWLHDVVEDASVKPVGLLEAGFSLETVEAVIALTHAPGESHHEYIDRLCQNETAKRVKLADLADNMDPSRALAAKLHDPEQVARIDFLLTRYAEAKFRIENGRWSLLTDEVAGT
ncbi:MAG: hypothetical protein IPH08_03950 [Rhodocyclaceae bacterium]|nr:hypothetical protein [Rhodocyclaceae bacterium]